MVKLSALKQARLYWIKGLKLVDSNVRHGLTQSTSI
jgi:hypothetical protein